MASLALAASLVVLFTIFIGPITYLTAKLNFPKLIVYMLSVLSVFVGINFCLLAIPVWYLGLIPIYCAYISIRKVRADQTKG